MGDSRVVLFILAQKVGVLKINNNFVSRLTPDELADESVSASQRSPWTSWSGIPLKIKLRTSEETQTDEGVVGNQSLPESMPFDQEEKEVQPTSGPAKKTWTYRHQQKINPFISLAKPAFFFLKTLFLPFECIYVSSREKLVLWI